MAFSWKDLESKLNEQSGEELAQDIHKATCYLLQFYGTPNDYYDGGNPQAGKVNDIVDDLRVKSYLMFLPQNKAIVEKLYTACTGNDPEKEVNGEKNRCFELLCEFCFLLDRYSVVSFFHQNYFIAIMT